jgi:hypothetical protein
MDVNTFTTHKITCSCATPAHVDLHALHYVLVDFLFSRLDQERRAETLVVGAGNAIHATRAR